MDLNVVWFILIVVLFAGYAILDGFDLGIGAQILSFKKEKDRRLLLKTIAPFWNGNEVWLVAGGGALFAAFPYVYASVFSGLYIAFMLLLTGIIFRALAIEFRNKEESLRWRKTWDIILSFSSIIVLFILGVAVGNLIFGLPIDENGNIHIAIFDLFTPMPIIMGLQTVFFFAMHGALYGSLKTDGEIQKKLIYNTKKILIFVLIFFVLSFLNTNFFSWSNVLEIIALLFIVCIIFLIRKNKHGIAFIISSFAAMLYISSIALFLFPNFVISTIDYKHSLNIYNAASSSKTLEIMLTIALIGMPIVLFYTVWIYRKFRGKVKLEE